ncbi:hypothetical protein H4R22_000947 [Coemansia sp. RSA 1290]|nr:hypothetical protein H4R22_000947 [Coemansia sp. RSA 1290]KAJ2653616.1 hypothetical protein IWW40_000310 [Coemansia sp. RSA 1250]
MNTDEFRKYGKEVVDTVADYYDDVNDLKPFPDVEPGFLFKLLPQEAPFLPESFEAIQEDIETKIMPGMTNWQSGNFYAWFSSSSSFPAMLGEYYSLMFNVIGFSWLGSPAAAELEIIVMDWLAKLLGLDKRYLSLNADGTMSKGGGSIQTTASESLVSCMVAGREMALDRLRKGGMSEDELDQHRHKMVAYVSDQTHCSGEKAANILGCKVHTVQTDGLFRLTKQALNKAILEDKSKGLIPFFVCGSFGTTNTNAIDDLSGIADVVEAEHLWYHVDAAYAGAALVCPEFRSLAQGIERADSLSINPHKWLLTNFDCSALWVADSTYLEKGMCIKREYLPRNEGSRVMREFSDWQIPLGKRFRALKLWFVMRMYGVSGICSHIRGHVEQAKWLERQLIENGNFEIMAPVVFGLVVFRINPGVLNLQGNVDLINRVNIEFIQRINSEGKVFIMNSLLNGQVALRAPIGAVHGSQKNTELLFCILVKHLNALIKAF